MDAKYSKASFLGLKDDQERDELCKELASALVAHLGKGADFHDTVQELVSELRDLGHDLWSFDEDDDMEVWTPNYQNPTGPGIVIRFRPDEVEVDWSSAKAVSSP